MGEDVLHVFVRGKDLPISVYEPERMTLTAAALTESAIPQQMQPCKVDKMALQMQS